jgi:hypothetical protein
MSNVKVSREISSAAGGLAVTPSDTTTFDPPGRGLYVGVTGNVAVRMAGDLSVLTFIGVQGGTVLSICVDRVMSTNTTATDMILLR